MTSTPASILDRPMYAVPEAAALPGLRTDRARSWLDGYSGRGAQHDPVTEAEPAGGDTVTWGDFVGLGFLRGYRRKAYASSAFAGNR